MTCDLRANPSRTRLRRLVGHTGGFSSASSDFKILGAFFRNVRPVDSTPERDDVGNRQSPGRRASASAQAGPPASETGWRKIEILSAFRAFSRLCTGENFAVGRDVDASFA
jgi:hypothetical protein